MGGLGSGGHDHWWRPERKTTVEDCLAIDASRWTRAGVLRAGVLQLGRWAWADPRTGAETASVGYTVNTVEATEPWVRLSYAAGPAGEPIAYSFGLVATTPHWG